MMAVSRWNSWAIVLLLAVGCTERPDQVRAPFDVRVSPAELFVGDAKRLESHLRLTSYGCVRLDFQEPLWLALEVELWREGKTVRFLARSGHRLNGSGEASLSLAEENDRDGKPKHQLVVAVTDKSGCHSGASSVDVAELRGTGVKITAKLREAVGLEEGNPIAVWALLGYDNFEQAAGKDQSPAEGPNRAKWAIVFKVSWEKTKD